MAAGSVAPPAQLLGPRMYTVLNSAPSLSGISSSFVFEVTQDYLRLKKWVKIILKFYTSNLLYGSLFRLTIPRLPAQQRR
jgi:hypothetical protein